MTKKWYLYILLCADTSLYIGISPDISKRVLTHNAGKGAKYTKTRLPVKLVYQEELEDHSQALKRELALKKLSRPEKLKLVAEYQAKN